MPKAGQHIYNNGIIEKAFYETEEIPYGFISGKLPKNKEKLKTYKGTSGKHIYNNGEIEKFFYDTNVQPGFVRGRLSSTKSKISVSTQNFFDGLTEEEKVERGSHRKGVPSWNSGLTKDIDERVAKGAEAASKAKKGIPTGRPCLPQTKQAIHDALYGKKRTKESIEKQFESRKLNGTTNSSRYEEKLNAYLVSKYGEKDIFRNYNKDSRYPFHCDFYIKSLDCFIELNYNFTHGPAPFDSNNTGHLALLSKWQEKSIESNYYKNAITVWTITDKLKIETAIQNNINMLLFYPTKYLMLNNFENSKELMEELGEVLA